MLPRSSALSIGTQDLASLIRDVPKYPSLMELPRRQLALRSTPVLTVSLRGMSTAMACAHVTEQLIY